MLTMYQLSLKLQRRYLCWGTILYFASQNNRMWSNVEYFHHRVCIYLLCSMCSLHTFCSLQPDNQPAKHNTGDFKSVVLKLRRESAHARTFGGDFELKILRMRRFSSRFWTMDLKSPVLCFAGWLSEYTASHTAQNNTLWSNVEHFHHKLCMSYVCLAALQRVVSNH